MNLTQVIHQRWAAAAPLADLLPEAHVYTGMSAGAAMPYAVMNQASDQPRERYNDGSTLNAVGLRIQVFHRNYDEAVEIVGEILAVFDRTSFALADGDRVINMQPIGQNQQQAEDGVWQMTVDFECSVHTTGR